MRLLIMGPPGAGKGTQAKAIAEHYRIPAISTGDMFRAAAGGGTEVGRQLKQIMDTGGYVDDDTTNKVVADRLEQDDARDGFLLDGYPRTPPQVEALDAILAEQGNALDTVLSLRVDTEEVVQRLRKRAETEGRGDDTEDAIRVRQQKYADETSPLLDLYRQRQILVEVDGLGAVDDVTRRVFAALG